MVFFLLACNEPTQGTCEWDPHDWYDTPTLTARHAEDDWLEEGHANMRINDALDDDEVADGYILTCQGVPDTETITVRYE